MNLISRKADPFCATVELDGFAVTMRSTPELDGAVKVLTGYIIMLRMHGFEELATRLGDRTVAAMTDDPPMTRMLCGDTVAARAGASVNLIELLNIVSSLGKMTLDEFAAALEQLLAA